MTCNPFLRNTSPAMRRYNAGVALTMGGYLLAVFGTATFVHRHHPHGITVYLLSAMPAFCIFAMLAVVVTYLRDEKDEYVRMLMVRSLLAAAFVVLAIGAYNDFLRSFGDLAPLPPFSQWVVFWIVFAIAQAIQYRNDATPRSTENA